MNGFKLYHYRDAGLLTARLPGPMLSNEHRKNDREPPMAAMARINLNVGSATIVVGVIIIPEVRP